MPHMSDNYRLRKCFLQQDHVPTQSMIKKMMKPPLAAVFFKSMNPKLKVLAGLEPPLKGGGGDWFVNPKDVLAGRVVLKPFEERLKENFNHTIIEKEGEKLFQAYHKSMDTEMDTAVREADFRSRGRESTAQELENIAVTQSKKNTESLVNTFNYFSHLYRMSLDKIEKVCQEGAIEEIKTMRQETYSVMQKTYQAALESQARKIYQEYQEKRFNEVDRLKAEFIRNVEICRCEMADKIHDLNIDKHLSIEKLRQLFKYQTLACQVYVALKEREECAKEIEEMTRKHRKITKSMTDDQEFKQHQVRCEIVENKTKDILNKLWQKKVCHLVKKFQNFVSYCLTQLPEHAEFFLNMEKLLFLQVNEALVNPTAESVIEEAKEETFHTPVPQSEPFYLFCDKGYQAPINQSLYQSGNKTSSASQLPAIIINKRCLYAACDNFEQFTNKIKKFIHGNRGDDNDFNDELIYEHFVPVNYTTSQQLLELKLESSLLKILQYELDTYKQGDIPMKCEYRKWPWCKCTSVNSVSIKQLPSVSVSSIKQVCPVNPNLGTMELVHHEREPKWESFFAYVEPKKCSCDQRAKKHLVEKLPAYMRKIKYGPAIMPPNYEMCSVAKLKSLIKQSRRRRTPSFVAVPEPSETLSLVDIGTQCNDLEFEVLCTCFSDSDIDNLQDIGMKSLKSSVGENLLEDYLASPSYLRQRTSSFATDRANSLRNLIEGFPDIKEIFMKRDCDS